MITHLVKAIIPIQFYKIFLKQFTEYQGHGSNSFCDILLDFHLLEGHNFSRANYPRNKQKTGKVFFMQNPHMKFQDISMHGSKVI